MSPPLTTFHSSQWAQAMGMGPGLLFKCVVVLVVMWASWGWVGGGDAKGHSIGSEVGMGGGAGGA